MNKEDRMKKSRSPNPKLPDSYSPDRDSTSISCPENLDFPKGTSPVLPSIGPIGEVNTPLEWAVWAAERYGLVDLWIEGATVLDPTMGEGNLLEAFLYAGIQRGIPPEKLPVHTLFGMERRGEKIQRFLQRVKDRYHLEVPRRNFIEADMLTGDLSEAGTDRVIGPQEGVDILFGNPPWITFASLPEEYKDPIKPLFLRYSLVKGKSQALLGKSRVDLSALIVLVALSRFLRAGGQAVFFLPLSLFFGEGAGEGFRQFRSLGIPFQVQELIELPMEKVFPGVSTRGGLVYLKRDKEQRFPVQVGRIRRPLDPLQNLARLPMALYGEAGLSGSTPTQRQGSHTRKQGCHVQDEVNKMREESGPSREEIGLEPELELELELWKASPIDGSESPWILYQGEHPFSSGIPRIPVPLESFPRQGINTCGANDLFFFESVEKKEEEVWRVSNSSITCLLPSIYLFPLLTSKSFREKDPIPHKWVFLPYQKDGQPLSRPQMEANPYLRQFVDQYGERLEARKGVLIQSWIRKGFLWALFGVGAYCFFPWKIAWEAAGRKKFSPRIWEGSWQANQSLFGYLPFKNLEEAERVLEALQDPRIEEYLLALQTQGTLNWAQPGRMKRLFTPIRTQGRP